MSLVETFETVRPSIVALFSRLSRSHHGKLPLFPTVLGTGFFVDPNGIVATNRHVVEALESLPKNPKTGAASGGALVFLDTYSSNGQTTLGMLNVDIVGSYPLQQFEIKAEWYGEEVPDLAFMQIGVRNVPFLTLSTTENTIKVGRSIATAGFPSGTDAIAYDGRLTQFTPILRHGIISSVFPFAGPNPHGFSIDALIQGGASGSPVFFPEEPSVVGMIASRLPDTNFTVAIPGHLLQGAMDAFMGSGQVRLEDIPTLEELVDIGREQRQDELIWDTFVTPPQDASV
jgi:S1-C subfamily serine protease